jgi:hypothetical protein
MRNATRLLLFLGAGATLGTMLPIVASATIVATLSAGLVALRLRRRRKASRIELHRARRAA